MLDGGNNDASRILETSGVVLTHFRLCDRQWDDGIINLQRRSSSSVALRRPRKYALSSSREHTPPRVLKVFQITVKAAVDMQCSWHRRHYLRTLLS
jgi:hypothetical protein